MSRKSRTTLSVVEKLIEQRRLFQDWLTKLDAGIEGMPPKVVGRVRNDYRTRLEAVMAELAEHQDSLQQALGESQERHAELDRLQNAKREELAELRLRKHVGELDEDRFRVQSADLKNALEGLQKELANAQRDIERYEEILETIAAPEPEPEPAEEDREEVVSAGAASGRARDLDDPDRSPAGGGGRADDSKDSGGGRDALDELAFLRSVTGAGAPKRTAKAPLSAPPPPPRSSAPSAPEPSRAAPAPTAVHTAPPTSPSPAAVAAAPEPLNAAPGLVHMPPDEPQTKPAAAAAGRPGTGKDKSMKCGECGAPNLPTEWYCEKCGAELSAF